MSEDNGHDKPKRKPGRPKGTYKRRMTDELLSQVRTMAGLGLTRREIAQVLDIGERTIGDYQQKEPEFAAAIEKGHAEGISIATGKLREKIKAGDLGAIIFYLKAQAGWREKQEIHSEQTIKHEISDEPAEPDPDAWKRRHAIVSGNGSNGSGNGNGNGKH